MNSDDWYDIGDLFVNVLELIEWLCNWQGVLNCMFFASEVAKELLTNPLQFLSKLVNVALFREKW